MGASLGASLAALAALAALAELSTLAGGGIEACESWDVRALLELAYELCEFSTGAGFAVLGLVVLGAGAALDLRASRAFLTSFQSSIASLLASRAGIYEVSRCAKNKKKKEKKTLSARILFFSPQTYPRRWVDLARDRIVAPVNQIVADAAN